MSSQLFDKLFVQHNMHFLNSISLFAGTFITMSQIESILDYFSPVRPITFIFIS